MVVRLIGVDGGPEVGVRAGATLVLGRSRTSDVPIEDASVSRRHASLVGEEEAIRVLDLGSSNGTYVNGVRVTEARVGRGDLVTFGRVTFRVSEAEGPAPAAPSRETAAPVTRQVVRPVPATAAHGLGALGTPTAAAEPVPTGRRVRQLEALLQLSVALAEAIELDALLAVVAERCLATFDADRAVVLLRDEEGGELVPRVQRARPGMAVAIGAPVPRGIVRAALEERAAVLSEDAGCDERLATGSVLAQGVRSAACVPLMGSGGAPVGALYLDTLGGRGGIREADLDFAIAFAGVAGIAVERERLEERLRREAAQRGQLERFFSPGLAARLVAEREVPRPGGARRPVTVLFSDIREFTRLSESMTPDDTAHLLSEYFEAMSTCVFRHGGTLDKFMGDALLAVWGAPIAGPDDADRALAAARDMQDALVTLNAVWSAAGRPTLAIGIGVNAGEAFVGNVGSERRLEYTVIGDVVNVASRLCALAAGGEVLLTDDVRQLLTASPPLEPSEEVTLRGRRAPVPLFRLAR